MSAPSYLGVTPPISSQPPTARDLEVSKTLIEELKTRGIYENPAEGRNRYVSSSLSFSHPNEREEQG
jgi:poly(A) polymerase